MDFAVPGRKVSERLDRNERFCKAEFRRNEKGREIYPAFFSFFLYFIRVASPPRMCLSALFSSRIFLTCFAIAGLSFLSLSVTSLCTVLLLIPKVWAAALTVDLFSMINAPSSRARSTIYCFKTFPSYSIRTCLARGVSDNIYMHV